MMIGESNLKRFDGFVNKKGPCEEILPSTADGVILIVKESDQQYPRPEGPHVGSTSGLLAPGV